MAEITPNDIATAQAVIDQALATQAYYENNPTFYGRGNGHQVRIDLNPEYVNDAKKLAEQAAKRYEAISAENDEEGPFLYTKSEILERLAWTDLTSYGETPIVMRVRDLNVYYWTRAIDEDPIDLYLKNEKIDGFIRDILENPFIEASTKKIVIDNFEWIKERNDLLRVGTLGNKDFDEIEDVDKALNILLNSTSKTLLPKEIIEDYMRQFQKWWAKGKGIRNLLYKFFTGAITEEEFNNAVLKFKETSDYKRGFYDEEIEV